MTTVTWRKALRPEERYELCSVNEERRKIGSSQRGRLSPMTDSRVWDIQVCILFLSLPLNLITRDYQEF